MTGHKVALQSLTNDAERDLRAFLTLVDTYDRVEDWEAWHPAWAFKYQKPAAQDGLGQDDAGESVSGNR